MKDMRRVCTFLFLFWGLGIYLCAQTVTIEKPMVTPSQEKYKVVEASNLLHAIEGATAVYKISVTGYDSIVSVKSLRYNSTDITTNCHLDNGVLTIDDVTITNLRANRTQDFKITLIVREKGKEVDTERSAEAMGVKVYSEPSGKEVEKPNYLTFYKDSEENLTWKFKGTGGNLWKCTWDIDNKDNSGNSFTLSRIREAKTSKLKLLAINLAPDGSTEWDRYEEDWQIVVLPEATTKPSVEDKTSEELFQDQEWALSVAVDGGNSSGWEYSWAVDDVKTSNNSSYTLIIGESERSVNEIERKVVLSVKNNLPAGTKPTKEKLEWTYNYSAKFYPCPEVRFAENYPHNICDGDNITFGFVILDGQGNSLINDPDYEWDYSWGEEKSETYLFEGKNVNNEEGENYAVKCEISGRLKGIEKPYTRTLLHNVSVWPKPIVKPFSESESYFISCGGRNLPISLRISGGQKDGWEYYYGKKGDVQSTSKDSNHVFSIVRESSRSTQTIKEDYIMRAVNYIDGVIRCDTTLSITVYVYPEPWMPNDIVIIDRNRQNVSVESGVRVGNEIILSCEECYGGYPNVWNCFWSRDNTIISNTYETLTAIEELYSGDTKDDSRVITFKCGVDNFFGTEQWAVQEYTKHLTIYNKPKTPISLEKKGNGTSGTMIATTSVSDTDLEGHEYYLVFGYLDANGQMHDATSLRQQNAGEVRWSTQISTSEINNSGNTLYVYALWKYDNGVEITSGLRFVNSVDEYWDGSSYTGGTRAVIANTTGINNVYAEKGNVNPCEYYSIKGMKLQKQSQGINIIRMSDGTVKKVMVK